MADTYPAMTITLLGLAQLRYSHKLSVFYDLFIWLLTTLGASFRQNIGIFFFLHFRLRGSVQSRRTARVGSDKRSAAQRLNNRTKFRPTSAGSNIKDSAVEKRRLIWPRL